MRNLQTVRVDQTPLPITVPRADLDLIESWIPEGARVLDLGCGDGAFLARLQQTRKATGYGVEIDDVKVHACVRNGVNVIQQDLEAGLAMFEDHAFDVVILSQTLQAMHNTERILREIARVGKEGIVSFPNFGHWYHIWSIALGRMPVSKQMPYEWYNTPNIHLCTVKDFEALVTQTGFQITGKVLFLNGQPVQWLGALRSTLAVYRFRP
ncbi:MULTISPECIES: methionine biosynthesis protein MetW [Limnobacter]|uniref:Methionine biosynthesis protein MetW n=1 Tax=Limnobacter litoralis TaxID=481366 RepID=A0ABQ5YSL8_9BURK|nr:MULTISPECIES: methionine biosynthesis protein MetW [Limnobacter]GLR25442.1 methionine biosynthesis protein MetW [Limnobacter litoralis]HEX5485277.1 methionine biosynthesis protein MetW [Limnobacter sp.]